MDDQLRERLGWRFAAKASWRLTALSASLLAVCPAWADDLRLQTATNTAPQAKAVLRIETPPSLPATTPPSVAAADSSITISRSYQAPSTVPAVVRWPEYAAQSATAHSTVAESSTTFVSKDYAAAPSDSGTLQVRPVSPASVVATPLAATSAPVAQQARLDTTFAAPIASAAPASEIVPPAYAAPEVSTAEAAPNVWKAPTSEAPVVTSATAPQGIVAQEPIVAAQNVIPQPMSVATAPVTNAVAVAQASTPSVAAADSPRPTPSYAATQQMPLPPHMYPGYDYFPLVEGQQPLLSPQSLSTPVASAPNPILAQDSAVALLSFAQDTTPPAVPLTEEEKKKQQLQPDQKLGEAPPPSNNTLQFLRRQAPLMPAGTWQFDIGFAYALYDFDAPIPIVDGGGNVIGVAEANYTNRLLTMPMELRYGVSDYVQSFVSMPVGYSDSEISILNLEDHEEVGGIGDVRAGINAMLVQGCGYCPDVVGTVAFLAPTGDPGNPIIDGLNPSARLGEGFWSAAVSVLFIHQYDPIVVFYGIGYRHRFEAEIAGIHYQPGEEVNYQLGMGFAVNPEITLSCGFVGAYIGHWDANGTELAGSVLEPMRLRSAITVLRNDYIVEPFAEVGMSQDAPTGRVGITWTF